MKKTIALWTLIFVVGIAGMAFANEDASKAEAATEATTAATAAEATAPMRTICVEDKMCEITAELSETFFLHPMQVNLLNGETHATIDLPQDGRVEIKLYDRLGREVMNLHDGDLAAGRHTFVFREHRLPIETFYLRISYESDWYSVEKRVFL